jgi:hypothetical protein
VEALTMHLANTTPTPCRRRLGVIPLVRRTGATCSRQRDAQYPVTRHARWVSRRRNANFLEFIRAGFHYSVIVRDGAFSSAAGVCFRGPGASVISRNRLRVRMHKEMKDGASTNPASSGSEPATGRSMQKRPKKSCPG